MTMTELNGDVLVSFKWPQSLVYPKAVARRGRSSPAVKASWTNWAGISVATARSDLGGNVRGLVGPCP